MTVPAAITGCDVAIIGGGLAGLTLAVQLKQRFGDLHIVILERRTHPVPAATHKVGESTVEIGANYFDTVLGLKDHLISAQLKKFGFRFFFSDRSERIDQVGELGASSFLATPGYQIDRGIFENFLAQHAAALGAQFIDGAVVREISMGQDGGMHQVAYQHADTEHRLTTRWLIDASGRAGLVKRKLELQLANAHDANAVWFRIGCKVDVDDWSNDRQWLTRCDPPQRWLSTNHLVGDGYWVWLIPLSSGSHSVGIVADAKTHPLHSMNTFDKAMDWLADHQPQLARDLEGKRDQLQDFMFLRNFSYSCRQVFSGERWALTGESGVFLDPFYSPGSDFIAISNTYITELIAIDRAGGRVDLHARLFDQLFMSFYDSTLSLYVDQYPVFGDAEVLPVKVIWDYTYYWGVLCQLYFQRRLADIAALGRLRGDLEQCKALNEQMQQLLRRWSAVSRKANPAVLLDQARLPWFAELNRGLRDELDDDGFFARMRATVAQLKQLANEIAQRVESDYPLLDTAAVRALCVMDATDEMGRLLFDAAA